MERIFYLESITSVSGQLNKVPKIILEDIRDFLRQNGCTDLIKQSADGLRLDMTKLADDVLKQLYILIYHKLELEIMEPPLDFCSSNIK